ncbi:oxidoreductase [Pseudoxanthomonas sp. Root630]|nr:oxidoreductase [Pseudoxanthomonas sp. Root630]
MHVAIIGYGTAGQAAALLLSRDGHRVEVFERAAEPGPVGAGFLLQPTGLQVLWELGLLADAMAHGRRVNRLYGETPCGRAVMDMRYDGLDARLFGLGMQRGALFSLLDAAWQGQGTLHRDHAIDAVSDDTRRIRDQHGRWHGPFDLVVAADGSASALRAATGAVKREALYPWGALWRLVPQQAWAWPDELRQRYLAARKMIGLLPVGTRPGDPVPRLSFFWSLPVADFDAWRARGLPAWREEVARLWPEAEACLADTHEPDQLARASYRDVALRRWHRGRLVVLGDAAHGMSPQLGQGVNMALMDAMALRDRLRAQRDVETALSDYQRTRQAHVGIYQFWSRWLTPIFQSDRDAVAWARDVAFLPLGRLPGGRGHMLRVLSGTQHGLLGTLRLEPGFLRTIDGIASTQPFPAPSM